MTKSRMMAATAALCCCAATSLTAQSLSHVQILALQQQLRDDGCGVAHATGVMDAPTRRAVERCKSKYNVSSGGAAELLAAMNIGFGAGDNVPTVAGAPQGISSAGVGGSVGAASSDSTVTRPHGKARARGAARRRARAARADTAKHRGSMPSDSTRMPVDTSMQAPPK